MADSRLDELLQRFADAVGIKARAQFVAGDILIEAVQRYGSGVLGVFAEHARRTRRWCEICLAVAKHVPPELREQFPDLPWTVFRFAVAHQDVRPVREWLQLAADQGLSERQLAAMLRGGELSSWSGSCDCGARFRVEAESAAGGIVHCPLCGAEVGVMEPVVRVRGGGARGAVVDAAAVDSLASGAQ